MNMSATQLLLTFSCEDKPGIVAEVAGFFSRLGFNIRESSQYEDELSRRFFMRTEFNWLQGVNGSEPLPLDSLQSNFEILAKRYQMDWALVERARRLRVVIAVSKWGHCLNTLLNNWRLGSLPIEVVAVVSNHTDMESFVNWYRVPFHHLPVDPDNKDQQEAQLQALLDHYHCDLLVLARYMQILSDDLCQRWAGKAINIHHSFLPGFKGAKPYHQAHERGVKLIGATAHYITSELDEGPIIEQAVERVSHANTPEEMVEKGRDIEAVVLQRAVRWHAEHRVLLNGNKTVVFNR
jgi:formyltetrahydrofolate deformylase